MALFPYSNFHDINLDWIVGKLKRAVYTINGQSPDDEGNVTLPAVAGVSSVNGVGPDSVGNVTLTASDVNALPASYSAPVQSVQGKTGNVILSASDVNAMPVGYVPPVQSVNGQTGAVALDASDVGALPDTYVAPVTSVNGWTGNVVLNANDVNALPDTTVIPTLTSQLVNDSGFITSQQAGAVLSVNGQVGAVVLDYSDVSALPDTTVIPNRTSQLINDSGFITSAQAAPVDSVNGYTGVVVLTEADVGAAPAAAAIPQGGAAGYVLTKDSATDYDVSWSPAAGGTWTETSLGGGCHLLNCGNAYTLRIDSGSAVTNSSGVICTLPNDAIPSYTPQVIGAYTVGQVQSNTSWQWIRIESDGTITVRNIGTNNTTGAGYHCYGGVTGIWTV